MPSILCVKSTGVLVCQINLIFMFFTEKGEARKMDTYLEAYWQNRLNSCREALEENHFEAFVAGDAAEAREIVVGRIFPQTSAQVVSWGDSMTLHATGILQALEAIRTVQIIRTFDKSVSRAEIIERRRQALLSDLFLTGSNAITEDGQLVNLDMIGNRVAAVTFGPRHVVIVAGRNKIVPGLEAAIYRVKEYAAPVNAIRHHFKTPCVKTSTCANCKSPERICNVWTITEKSFPKGRIRVILINQDLGL